jgi:heptaprenyl diphosphate synthase
MRRGKPSVLARYGAAASLVAGDFLFCRAFELCGRFEERLVRIAAHACISLTEGEVMEGRMRHNAAARIEDYLEIITRKTASLFAAGARVAADLAGAAPATVGALEAVGLALGRSFQMMDDVLDVSGSEERIGKPIGSDLRTGVLSLPLVLGMHELPELRNFFANGGHGGAAAIESALRMVRHPSILERARAMAAEQAALARHHLGELAPSIYRDSLGLLLDEQRDRAT